MVKKYLPGDTIGAVDCDGCGGEVPLKLNKNGNVYAYCARVVGERDNGKPEKCFTRYQFGRKASQEIVNELEKSERLEDEAEKHAATEHKDGGNPEQTRDTTDTTDGTGSSDSARDRARDSARDNSTGTTGTGFLNRLISIDTAFD